MNGRTLKPRPIWSAALALALATSAGVLFVAPQAQAREGAARQVRKVQPIYEAKKGKGWDFDDGDNLEFYNRSPNPDGTRFLKWKGYIFVVNATTITVIDPRPYGTRLSGTRFQRQKKGKIQDDEELMKYLKDQAEDVREANEPDDGPPVNLDIGVGFGFRF